MQACLLSLVEHGRCAGSSRSKYTHETHEYMNIHSRPPLNTLRGDKTHEYMNIHSWPGDNTHEYMNIYSWPPLNTLRADNTHKYMNIHSWPGDNTHEYMNIYSWPPLNTLRGDDTHEHIHVQPPLNIHWGDSMHYITRLKLLSHRNQQNTFNHLQIHPWEITCINIHSVSKNVVSNFCNSFNTSFNIT